jgi:hypothetical protein
MVIVDIENLSQSQQGVLPPSLYLLDRVQLTKVEPPNLGHQRVATQRMSSAPDNAFNVLSKALGSSPSLIYSNSSPSAHLGPSLLFFFLDG